LLNWFLISEKLHKIIMFAFLFALFCPLYAVNAAETFTDWKIDSLISDSMEAGTFGKTFRISLPIDASTGDINFGAIRFDVNQTTGDNPKPNSGRSMLYLSTSNDHGSTGVGPAWPIPRYTWAISSSGTIHVTRCETDPMSEPQFAAKNNQPAGGVAKQHSSGVAANAGNLVEETMTTTAFCLPRYQWIAGSPTLGKPLSHRVDTSTVAEDAPNAACQCIGESLTTKYVYARARCYGQPGLASGCSFTASVSATCPLGTAPGVGGECRLCEVDNKWQNAASVVTADVGSGNTIASAQCLDGTTCPAGTKFLQENIVRGALDNFYTPKSSEAVGGRRRLNTAARVGWCERCPKPLFSLENSTSCAFTANSCPAGTYANWRTQACTKCAVGKWSDTLGATSADVCQSCGIGKFLPFTGATNANMCLGCPQDTYNDRTSAGACLTCPEGK
jgi:hypothetical protein